MPINTVIIKKMLTKNFLRGFLACMFVAVFLCGQLAPAVGASELEDFSSDSEIQLVNPNACDPTGEDPDAPPCASTCEEESGGDLVGSVNEEKIFNFFVGKELKPFQAAGIIGNIKHESGFEPQRQQGIFDRKVPAESFPDPAGASGWGIVQFTPGSKFINPTKAAGKDPNKLEVQLEFIWEQLQGKGPVPENPKILQQIKATTTIRDAVLAFQGNTSAGGSFIGYERPADQAGSVDSRTAAAKSALTKYGSGAPGGSGDVADTTVCGSGGEGTADGGEGEVTGTYSLPVAKKWYTSNKQWFTKPHHDYPAADIPVPDGTAIYSMTAGKVIAAPNEGGFGRGVTIDAGNGVIYIYGHGSNGGTISGAKKGDTVKAGKRIMNSDNTGQSFGTHLHLEIRVNGTKVCPQKLFVSIAEGKPVDVKSLPTSGCSN